MRVRHFETIGDLKSLIKIKTSNKGCNHRMYLRTCGRETNYRFTDKISLYYCRAFKPFGA